MKLLLVIPFLALVSCAELPVSWGVEANGVNASYSSKGGLVIDIQPALLVNPAK
jgi:hypothetical protein